MELFIVFYLMSTYLYEYTNNMRNGVMMFYEETDENDHHLHLPSSPTYVTNYLA